MLRTASVGDAFDQSSNISFQEEVKVQPASPHSSEGHVFLGRAL